MGAERKGESAERLERERERERERPRHGKRNKRERERERERAMRFVRFSVKTSGVSLPFPTGVHANHSSSNIARESTSDKRVKVTFKLPQRVKFGQEVVLVGDDKALGSWSVSKGKKLEWQEGDMWQATVDLPCDTSIQYKYAVSNIEDTTWMQGNNFVVDVPSFGSVLAEDVWEVENECKRTADGDATTTIAAASVLATTTSEAADGTTDYHKMTVKEIKEILRQRGLPVSGKKADLIARLA